MQKIFDIKLASNEQLIDIAAGSTVQLWKR